ncbi:kazal-type serine peptidase inhibitor domain 2 [Scleropages formosus]|uniref:kazal-type serine peptidase inhibitor domain 2 n=1 Tax=Scleropages formosus TaxID=113540 RepID=UPI0010FA78DA|nr:kazal-type serine protease inhibitor domain-containing protein 1-like [Scleropages formosus]
MEIVALLLALSLLPWFDTLPARRYRPRDRRVSCPQCKPDRCPPIPRCPAGRTRDACDCCWECGNGEGRLCDPDTYFGTFFGRCGEGLSCRAGPRDPFSDEIPKPRCVCNRQELLCGSDHKTYENMCQFRAARFRLRDRGRLTVTHFGPCRAKPVIVGPPGDVTGKEGSDVVFSCKVLSYPMAVIEWRKEGNGIFLPADDTNMMVEAHGGPRRFELTGWLQIQNIQRADQGTYTCAARSPFGEVSASAKLCVLDKEVQPPRPPPQNTGIYDVPDDEDYESLSSGLSY